ncbi:MAG: tetrahydrofolate dehydrogenase/cyclohydrolase catalytic domain-containing protein [Planctomycetales bacterium]
MTARVIDGNAMAEAERARIATEAGEFQAQTGVRPHLAAILVGSDPASAVYVRNKRKACEKAGFGSSEDLLPETTTQAELLALIDKFNRDPKVHGILVQLPLPKQIDQKVILDAVHPLKDVDCFHPENVGLLAQGRARFLPCTPWGVQHMLLQSGVEIAGAHVVILGRSEIVGKPLAMMLVQKGAGADATVTVCHSRTKNLKEVTRTADILIAAIGVPEFVTAEMVRPGAVVIDVGINRTADGKLVGDVDFGPVSEVAAAISPVPRGVGPMTITMLLRNTLTAARLSV